MAHFDRSESFDVQIGIELAKASQKLEIPIFFQGWMQPADHVHFRYAETKRFTDRADDLFNCVLEGVGIAFLGGEGAELAGEHANVGVIDVTIVDVSGVVPVLLLAHDIGDKPERVEIV